MRRRWPNGQNKSPITSARSRSWLSKDGFGHFSSSTRYGKLEDTPEEFKERFRKNVVRINALVLDNGKECKVYRKDVNGLLSEVCVDLA